MVNSSGVLIRREVRSLTDDTLQWYAKAVSLMKGREPTDPTSWWYQAGIHGSHEAPKELFNQCKHASWYFVAWHRMYLYYFERIVRAAMGPSGPQDWAIPYWNYGLNGEFASIPNAFRSPTESGGNENPLYAEERRKKSGTRPGINEGARLPEAITTPAAALGRPQFIGTAEFGGGEAPPSEQFWNQTGQLEQTPHNDVHVAVGGPGGWMIDPDEAAKDPIFWLHHSNIDRVWAEWNVNHADPTASAWLNQKFEFFDENGTKVSKSCGEVLDTVGDLGYTYDVIPGATSKPPTPEPPEGEEEAPTPEAPPSPAEGEPVGSGAGAEAGAEAPSAYANSKVVGASEEKVTLTGSAEAVPVAIDNRAQEEVLEASRAEDPRRLYLNIEDIEGEKNPGTVYGVYVNLPENPDEKTLAAHHAGNVSFFGIERARNPRGDEHGHNLRVSMDVGELLRSIGGGQQFGDEQVQVTFLPLSLISPEGESQEAFHPPEEAEDEPPVHIGRVSLTVD
jgi:tyrosinase